MSNLFAQNYAALLGAFCETPKAELTLMLRIQEYCYDNMNFMKVFQKIIFLLYKSEFMFSSLDRLLYYNCQLIKLL